MIECSLQPVVSQYYNTSEHNPKYGIYMQSMYWGVKGYGKKRWLVAVKIELNYEKAQEEGNTDDEIVEACVEFLNAPQKSKYGKKRMRKSLYSFEAIPYNYDIVEKDNKKTISARLITKDQKNKSFWNSGPST